MPVDPFQSARVFFPPGTGNDAAFVLEQAHGSAYLRGMHDQQRGLDPAPDGWGASVRAEAIRRVERELMTVLQEAGAAGYGRGYDDAAAGLARRAPCNPERATDRGRGMRRRVFSTTRRPRATCGDTTTGSAGPVVPTPLSGGIR